MERVTDHMATLGVYRPNTINAQMFFDKKISLMKQQFDLGFGFCRVMDTTYRELNAIGRDFNGMQKLRLISQK